MLTTVIVFIVILGVLVFVHELGHFVVAKKNGIKIHEFGFGFPPRAVGIQFLTGKEKEKFSEVESVQVEKMDIKVGKDEIIRETITEKIHTVEKNVPVRKWRIIWGSKDGDDENEKQDLQEAHKKNFSGGTIYSLNWIPIGGFVRIKGEDGEGKKDSDSFASKSAWVRIKVLAAGVIMNFVLAWILFSVSFMLGTYEDVTDQGIPGSKILIQGIEYGSPAQKMDLRIGDILVSNGISNFSTVSDVQNYISDNKGKEIILIINRNGKQLKLKGIPREKYDTSNQGALGITGFGETIIIKYSFGRSLWEGLIEIKNFFITFGFFIAQLFHGNKEIAQQVTGPIGIMLLTGKVASLGFTFIIRFVAMLSINLGIINIFPFPALDGGRILFILIEKIKGSKINQKIEQAFNSIGMILLLLLMLAITVKELFSPEVVDKIKNIF
jgi:regulator of sigma E protease